MPKLFNPDTQQTITVEDRDNVEDRLAMGFVSVGDRPETDYVGKSRDELADFEPEVDEPQAEEPQAEEPPA